MLLFAILGRGLLIGHKLALDFVASESLEQKTEEFLSHARETGIIILFNLFLIVDFSRIFAQKVKEIYEFVEPLFVDEKDRLTT